jgi:hypothetical protein
MGKPIPLLVARPGRTIQSLIDQSRNTGNLLASLLCASMAGRSHHLQKRKG